MSIELGNRFASAFRFLNLKNSKLDVMFASKVRNQNNRGDKFRGRHRVPTVRSLEDGAKRLQFRV